MSLLGRASRAVQAFRAGEPSKDATALRSMPSGEFGKTIRRSKKRINRMPQNYRMFEPASIREALDMADRSGVLGGPFGAASVAKWVRSNPVVHGVTSPLFDFTHGPVNVLHSEEAAAWLEGTATNRGTRTQICDPAELENMAINRHHCGWNVGIFIWNDCTGMPEFQSLDPAGVRYIPGEDRYEFHGWSKVFKIEPGNGIWVFDSLVKNAPWAEGAWQRLGNDCYGAINAAMLEDLWQQMFAIPWVWAVAPQGASDAQKAKFWQSAVGGAVLRVLGVTPGYDLKFLQATAEGKDSFAASDNRLKEHVSIDTWGTIGLISGGSGFANSDLFEGMKAGKIGKEARRQSRMENPQIWAPVLDWAVRAGKVSPAARNACIEYQVDSPAVTKSQAEAATILVEKLGYTPEEACKVVGLSKAALPQVATPAPAPAPMALEEEPDEPGYSEKLAMRMTERNESTCPCPNKADRYCPRCGVVARFEYPDEPGQPAHMVWHATRRRAA